jgi:hypothetical protein
VHGTSEGSGSGTVDSDSKMGMGGGCHWGWDDGAEGDSLRVADCLGEVVLAALIVAACWECTAGAQVIHLLDPLAE